MLIGVPLDTACKIVVAADVYRTAGIASMTTETEREEGTDYSAKNFGGVTCGPDAKAETVEKWINGSGAMCLKDWAFMAATSGNPAVVDGDGNVVGYATLSKKVTGACDAGTKPRLALVLARQAATGDGGCVAATADTGATNVVAHFLANTTDWQWDIPEFADARAEISYSFTGYSNPEIGAGPLNLWPATYTPNVMPATAMHAEVFVDPANLPAIDCDTTLAHPAVDVRA